MRLWVLPLLLVLGAALPVSADQPIAYSHKQHIALGLQCKDCHTNSDPGEMMGFPATAKCMACHRTIKKDSVAIEKLAGFTSQNRPVPWVRIYQIPAYVSFSHRTHLETGATCAQCHGPVAERDVIRKETDISMGGCMACHKAHKASLDCAYCHEPRQ